MVPASAARTRQTGECMPTGRWQATGLARWSCTGATALHGGNVVRRTGEEAKVAVLHRQQEEALHRLDDGDETSVPASGCPGEYAERRCQASRWPVSMASTSVTTRCGRSHAGEVVPRSRVG